MRNRQKSKKHVFFIIWSVCGKKRSKIWLKNQAIRIMTHDFKIFGLHFGRFMLSNLHFPWFPKIWIFAKSIIQEGRANNRRYLRFFFILMIKNQKNIIFSKIPTWVSKFLWISTFVFGVLCTCTDPIWSSKMG